MRPTRFRCPLRFATRAVFATVISLVGVEPSQGSQEQRPKPTFGITAGDVQMHRLRPAPPRSPGPSMKAGSPTTNGITQGTPIEPAKRVACTGYVSSSYPAGLAIRITFFDPFGNQIHQETQSTYGYEFTMVSWADAEYTGQYRCEGVLYVDLQVEQRQAEFGVYYSDHHFLIATFIPENNVEVPFLDLTYGGDQRGFTPNDESSRTREAGRLHHPRIVGNGFFEGPFATAGLTTEYQKSTSLGGDGNLTADAVNDWDWGGDKKLRWTIAGLNPTCVMTEESDTASELHCQASISDPLFDWGAFNSVDYDLRIRLEWTEPPDGDFPPDGRPPRYRFWGCHDGYPNYEAYVGGTTVYQFDHFEHGQGIFSLAPPCEWNPTRVGQIY